MITLLSLTYYYMLRLPGVFTEINEFLIFLVTFDSNQYVCPYFPFDMPSENQL